MRVCVTGASGFVGRLLVARLVGNGLDVTAVSRHDVSEPVAGVRIVRASSLFPDEEWDPAFQGCQVVVHCAARAHVLKEDASDRERIYRQVNVEATRALAEKAASSGVRRFVFLSSIGVHGRSTDGEPFSEQSPFAPEDAYARSKMAAEKALQEIAAQTGLEVVIIRPPLVYGPSAKGNFAAMVRVLERGWPLPLGAVTHNRRSFVALDNLIDLIRVCLDHPAAAGETFLVSDGEDVSTAEFLRRTARAMGRKARLVPVPVGLLERAARLAGREAAAQRLLGSLQIDSSKARKVLGWAPPVTMDEGLRRAVGERVHG